MNKIKWQKVLDDLNIDTKEAITSNETAVLIKNYDEDFNRLLDKTAAIREKEENRKILEEIHFDKIATKSSSAILFIIIVLINIFIIYIIVKHVKPIAILMEALTG